MSLYDKIITIYPNLVQLDFNPSTGFILLQNDGDNRGDYIAKWEHPTLPRPTQEQLDGVQ